MGKPDRQMYGLAKLGKWATTTNPDKQQYVRTHLFTYVRTKKVRTPHLSRASFCLGKSVDSQEMMICGEDECDTHTHTYTYTQTYVHMHIRTTIRKHPQPPQLSPPRQRSLGKSADLGS